MATILKTKPGINGANVLSIPATWDSNWFRHFINNSLKGADVRNAVGTGGITVTGNISSPYATIGFSGGSGISTVTSTGATITVTNPAGPTVNLDLPASGVTAGSYTSANITVNARGIVTAAANGSGGGSTLTNQTPDVHPSVPTGVGVGPNDEFETGSTIDTTGARYSGATAWTAFNNTGYTATISGDGSLILTNVSNTTALVGGFSQPLPGSGTWAYEAKISLIGSANAPGSAQAGGGLFLGTAGGASGKVTAFLFTGTANGLVVQNNTNATTFSANAFLYSNAIQAGIAGSYVWVYLRISFDGTNLNFGVSYTGVAGSFKTVFSATPASFLVTPTIIGITQGTPDTFSTVCDWFRRVA